MSETIAQLKLLSDAYTKTLGEKLLEIESAVHNLIFLQKKSKPDDEVVLNLTSYTHKLAGSAGTYGYTEISIAARQLEINCTRSEEKTITEHHQTLLTLLKALQTEVNKSLEENSSPAENITSILDTAEKNTTVIKNILLVEDDFQQATMLSTLLSNFNFNITHLSDLGQLKKINDELAPDLILMDIIFNNTKDAGLEAIQALKNSGALLCPVTFLSVRDDFEARLKAVRAGGSGYVVKPVNILDLIDSIDYLLPNNTSPYRALIVDDDEDITSYYQLILDTAGIEVCIVNNPLNAMECIDTFKPDTILLDVNMPQCNGIELAKSIRQRRENHCQVPIVFVTSEKKDKIRLAAILSGGDDIISKPIDASFLISTLIMRSERARALVKAFEFQIETEKRFRTLSQSANDPIITINHHGLINFWNRAAAQTFNYKESEVLGRKVTMLFSEDAKKHYLSAVGLLKVGNKSHFFSCPQEMQAIKSNGEIFPAEFSFSYWEAKGNIYLTAIIRDISIRKAEEKELKDAKNIAEKLNRNKSEFLSHISHELRTPLNAIIGFSELLKFDSTLNSEAKKDASMINEAGLHLLQMINELLDLSTIEAGKVDISMDSIAVAPLIEDSLSLVKSIADQKNITLHFNRTDSQTDYTLFCDAKRLRQALLNLLSNAIKYNREDKSVTVHYERVTPERVRISITDQGKGLTKEQQEKLFQPFERAGAEKTSIEGTGIGLTITKKIVELMGGEIGCTSTLDKGSTFWVELNIAKNT